MTDEAWNAGFVKCLGVRLAGDLIGDVDERRRADRRRDAAAAAQRPPRADLPFTLPADQAGAHWERLLDTADADRADRAFEGASSTRSGTVAGGPGRTRAAQHEAAHGDSAPGPDRAWSRTRPLSRRRLTLRVASDHVVSRARSASSDH